MRIVHFTWCLGMGGAESLLVDLVAAQSRAAEVSVVIGNALICPSILNAIPDGVNVVLINRPPGNRDPRFLLRLFGAVAGQRPDIVHCHNESAIAAMWPQRAPVVLTVHSTIYPLRAYGPFYDHVFAISDSVRSDIQRRCGPVRVTVVKNGIRGAAIKVKADGPSGEPLRLVQVGRLDHQIKGQDLLLESLAILRNQYGLTNIALDIIGDGPSADYLLRLRDGLGLGGVVRFLGAQPRTFVYDHLRDYDALIQPSRAEGFGLAIAEAMVARVQVVVSDIDGPMELIARGRFGSHFRSGSAPDLAAVLYRLRSAIDRNNASRMLDEARAHALRNFDVQQTALSYIRHYRGLLSGSRGGGINLRKA